MATPSLSGAAESSAAERRVPVGAGLGSGLGHAVSRDAPGGWRACAACAHDGRGLFLGGSGPAGSQQVHFVVGNTPF